MVATAQDFKMFAGETKNLVVRVRDNGVRIDLTGNTVAWALRSPSDVVVLTKQSGSGITITDPTGGEFKVSLAPGDTDGFEPGEYPHQAEITDSAGEVAVVTTGTITIERNFT